MKATFFGLLASVLVLSSAIPTPAHATVYRGNYSDGRPCTVTLEKRQGKLWVGVDGRVYPVDYKINQTHFVESRTDTDKILLSVMVTGKLIDAMDFRTGRARLCTVHFKK